MIPFVLFAPMFVELYLSSDKAIGSLSEKR
jgi:hypothetical protein